MNGHERRRYLAQTSGSQETNGKPITPDALKALPEELNRLAETGQEAMRDGSGLTLPSGRRSTKVLRNGHHKQPSL